MEKSNSPHVGKSLPVLDFTGASPVPLAIEPGATPDDAVLVVEIAGKFIAKATAKEWMALTGATSQVVEAMFASVVKDQLEENGISPQVAQRSADAQARALNKSVGGYGQRNNHRGGFGLGA